ncbi:IS110 family transposase [Rhizobium sp. RHZ02]|nr:IS110 family transposase [Rhizobium sp. RHZ02]
MKAPPLDSQDELLALRALVAEQAAKLESQEAEVIKRDSIIGLLRAQLELLRHRQHGASSEKIDRKIEQFELMLEEIEASRAETDARSGKGPLPELDDTPDKAKRRPLPDGLPTEERVYTAPCSCPTCGGMSFLKAPDKVVQVMEHVPASVKIVRHIEKRMVCKDCDTMVSGEMPSLPIERGKPGPGLLAHIMVAKFDDHIPLYRLSEMYDRLGIDISRSVMADWVGRVSVLLSPLRRGAKNDAADAAAICEAVRRPDMRFVPIKSEANQSFLMLHRARGLLVRQRTMTVCAIRAHLAEFGIIFGQGRQRIETIMPMIEEVAASLPEHARYALTSLIGSADELNKQIDGIETKLAEIGRSDPVSNLLSSIPGVGPITSTAIAATIPDARMFRSGREFAAWLGLTPRQNSSGGTTRLGGITKQGDAYLRHLLVIGARNIVRYPKARAKVGGAWIDALLQRRRPMIVAVAVANKLARVIWAMMTSGEMFSEARVKAA